MRRLSQMRYGGGFPELGSGGGGAIIRTVVFWGVGAIVLQIRYCSPGDNKPLLSAKQA